MLGREIRPPEIAYYLGRLGSRIVPLTAEAS